MDLLTLRMSNYADVDLQKAGWIALQPGRFNKVRFQGSNWLKMIQTGKIHIWYSGDERTSTSGISHWFGRMTANHHMPTLPTGKARYFSLEIRWIYGNFPQHVISWFVEPAGPQGRLLPCLNLSQAETEQKKVVDQEPSGYKTVDFSERGPTW